MSRCLGCHHKLEEGYYFCSITCACLCGYMNVRADGPRKDPKEINQEIIDGFLNNPPVREYDKEKY